MRNNYTISAGIVAGILSSFIFIGLGGRAAMKLIAIVTGYQLDFSIEGAIAALVFSTSIGAVGGTLFPVVEGQIPGSPSARGGYFGLLLFVVLIPMLPAAIQEEALMLGEYIPIAITVFGLLMMGYGVLLEGIARKLAEMTDKSKSEYRTLSYFPSGEFRNPMTGFTQPILKEKQKCEECHMSLGC